LDIGVLGYIGIVQHKEHSPEVLSIPPGTPCIFMTYLNTKWHISSNTSPSVTVNTSQLQKHYTALTYIVISHCKKLRTTKSAHVTWLYYHTKFQEPKLGDTNAGVHLLTLWSRILLEKPTGFQLVTKFPVF